MIAVAMLGTATKLKTARNINLQGAVSGSANFDGSGNVTITTTQTNIAVITGTMNLNANSQGNTQLNPMKTEKTSIEIDYPTGFNKNNCAILNVEFKRYTGKNYNVGWDNYIDSSDSIRGTLPYSLSLGTTDTSTKMTLSVGNMSTNQGTCYYRIILLKIS